MATQAADSSDFIKNLGRIYGTYTGGFLAFVILIAILELAGVPNRILGYLFVFFTLAVYAIIGVMTQTAQVSEYYVAGRRVPAPTCRRCWISRSRPMPSAITVISPDRMGRRDHELVIQRVSDFAAQGRCFAEFILCALPQGPACG